MATLRALVGAGSMLAFMGFVVLVPLGWVLVLSTAVKSSGEQYKARPGIGSASTAKIIRSR